MKSGTLIILGFGGHARSVADVALSDGWEKLVFVDEHAMEGETFGSFPVCRSLPEEISECWVFPAAGNNHRRQIQCENVGYPLARLIASNAHIGALAHVEHGTFVGHFAHIGPESRIGMGVILNTGSVIEHECRVGDFTHISVNATVAGRCNIGAGVMVGAGATIIDGITICDGITIGAGAVVIKDIYVPGTYAGVPAKRIECQK